MDKFIYSTKPFMSIKINGIAFDLEGTIVDVEAAHHDAHLAVALEAGVNLSLNEALKSIKHFIGGPDEKVFQEIFDLSDKKISVYDMLQRDKYFYKKFLQQINIQPRPGFVKCLNLFRQSGLPVSIGSLTSKQDADWLIDNAGIRSLFPEKNIVYREDVQKLKPEPDVYLETAKRMKIAPEYQLVFEDSPNGIKAAIGASSLAVGMPVYEQSHIIESLMLAGAKCIFSSWEKVNLPNLMKELNI